ncbi:uncharacterized protein L3040_006679 [Drepanopeziza brunnea f. sp. 'multigermtubi']|uniref:Uncharacterized protein n=1 Tax=Marssonina brunnea f. sp. multigermtubi (strain MB_m1) TaxID=1072389 RepID=K1XXM7_MARBU|nr:uncharacterized protein MBM_04420 [Drepanopeziza brunnea f. sp. 'multigermtubi' MB_m1]EKD17559.1 hypothetical protein MBM_04420 [Drepanopeziza brunnea f. sp. 'multigermtubi' MB_m1]KAJ5039006.1 hypothetical protein L3040_006679 [Drepanopeziza brunnea f. sp. 'multigermtubi']
MRIGFLAVSLLAAGRAAAVNEFNVNFPTSFSFNTTTKFFWGDGQGTDLTGLLVVGDTNPAVSYSLPLDSSACKKATIVGGVQDCVQFANNGTASFGGPYAANLVLGNKYHLVLQYTSSDLSSAGTSNSPVFTMINPIVSVPSTAKSTSSKPSSTKPSSATLSKASSSIVRPSSSGRLSSSPTTSRTSRATTSSSPLASTTTSASPPASSTTQDGEGLTPGAKAGIAIGVLAMSALASVAAYFLYRRRRASKKKKEEEARRRDTTGTNFQDIDIQLGSPVSRYEGGAGWKKKRGTPQAVGNAPQPWGRESVGLQGQGTPF